MSAREKVAINANVAEISVSNEPAADAEETQSLRSSLSDLREVVSYLRREKELMEAKYEVTKNECSRANQKAVVLQQRLDELNIQLRSEINQSSKKLAEDLQSKLQVQLHETNLLRDSTSVLIRDKNAVEEKTRTLEKILSELKLENNQLSKNYKNFHFTS
jgi:nucleoprotein TPR